MKRFVMIISAVILFFSALFFSGKIMAARTYSSSTEKLLSSSADFSGERFSFSLIETLPVPVKRYFRFALREGQPLISNVKLTHSGVFKTDLKGEPTEITGVEYFTVKNPGFLWKGTIPFATAYDSYICGTGNLSVYLAGALRIINAKGPAYDQAELLRWLGEAVWFPTALLPSKSLSWKAVDDSHARLEFSHRGLNIYYIITFGEKGEITRMETMRNMTPDRVEKWIGECSDYRLHDGIMIPTTIEAKWVIDNREQSYGRFTLTGIQYNTGR